MFFDNIRQIPQIASKSGTSIFVIPPDVRVNIRGAMILQPEKKSTITIEQVRQMTAGLGLKQTKNQFVIIRPADKLGSEAANALLKNLEEPSAKVHYILITDAPSRLLPTILSRAAIYFLQDTKNFNLEITASESQKTLAKKLIAASPTDLVTIAEKIAKRGKTARTEALETLGLAIEILYKSYFLTQKTVFIRKLPQFLTAYENISKNGHVKLHIVADLC